MWILSIGRDPMLLETRRLLLEAFGCQVLSVDAVDAALAALRGRHFDVVVLCHTLQEGEIKAARRALLACDPAVHIVRLPEHDDVSYDPVAFLRRVQRAASSSGAA